VVELHLRAADLTGWPSSLPVRIALDERTWEAARAVARLGDEDDVLRRDVAALVERIASLGLVVPAAATGVRDGPPKAFAVLWRALRPMIERLYLTPTLQEVGDATGVSIRQADRYIQEFVASFALVGQGWRSATRHLRLKLATLLLSAEGASVAEVASAVGYRSSDAMARAFRDAGMQAPTVVQEQIRALR
jgi:transcriptional regulator GlxA family with amidase domain